MKIEISNKLIEGYKLKETDIKELIAIALYKYKNVPASVAGSILGINEFQFKVLFEKKGDLKHIDFTDEQLDILKNLKVSKINNTNIQKDI